MNIVIAGTTVDNGVLFQTQQYDTLSRDMYYRLSKYKDRQITMITSSIGMNDWGGDGFWQSKNGNVYSCGWNGVFRLSGTKWSQIKETYSYVRSIGGADDKHIFVCEDNTISFYDGSSWSILNTGSSYKYYISKIWCSANEVFVAFSDGIRTYILHGK